MEYGPSYSPLVPVAALEMPIIEPIDNSIFQCATMEKLASSTTDL